jgi:hypothetical protein
LQCFPGWPLVTIPCYNHDSCQCKNAMQCICCKQEWVGGGVEAHSGLLTCCEPIVGTHTWGCAADGANPGHCAEPLHKSTTGVCTIWWYCPWPPFLQHVLTRMLRVLAAAA